MQIAFPRAGGQYVLFLRIAGSSQLVIGRLGSFRFDTGDYAYIGSARGTGGLSARLQRHMRPTGKKRQHWHIDYLARIAEIWAVGWSSEAQAGECAWSAAIASVGRRWPPHFGASDCRCAGHLIELPDKITIEEIIRVVPDQLHLEQFEAIS